MGYRLTDTTENVTFSRTGTVNIRLFETAEEADVSNPCNEFLKNMIKFPFTI